MKASCHCGAVSVTIVAGPAYINFCDCSLCAKCGGVWGYFSSNEVTITGNTQGYRRADYDEPAVEMRFCPICGTTTHWFSTEHYPLDRMGINMRIFEPNELKGVEARFPDGRNWFGDTDPVMRRPPGVIGEDVFL